MRKAIVAKGTNCEADFGYPVVVVGPYGDRDRCCNIDGLLDELNPRSPGTVFLERLLEEDAPPPPFLRVILTTFGDPGSTQYIRALRRHDLRTSKVVMTIESSEQNWEDPDALSELDWLESESIARPQDAIAHASKVLSLVLSEKLPGENAVSIRDLVDAIIEGFDTLVFFRPSV